MKIPFETLNGIFCYLAFVSLAKYAEPTCLIFSAFKLLLFAKLLK